MGCEGIRGRMEREQEELGYPHIQTLATPALNREKHDHDAGE